MQTYVGNGTYNLVGNIDGDRFSLRVVVTVHRVDAEQHCNAKQHDRHHHQQRDDSHPDWYREEASTVVIVAELVVADAESLKLNSTLNMTLHSLETWHIRKCKNKSVIYRVSRKLQMKEVTNMQKCTDRKHCPLICTDARHFLWPPYRIGQAIIFLLWFLSALWFLSIFFFLA